MIAKLRILAIVVILLAGGGAAYWFYDVGRAHSDGQIRVSGNIETTEAEVAFKIAGRVEKRLFDEGEMVKQGQLVAELDTADLQCNVDVRRAEVQTAKAALDELLAGSRREDKDAAKAAWEKAAHALADLEAGSRPQEIAAAEAAVAAADADLRRLEADLRRATALFQRKTISAEEYDAARDARDVAVEKRRQTVEQLSLTREGPRKEQIEQARAALDQAKAQYDLVLAGPRQEDIEQGRARLEQARAALKLAETQLSYAKVYAPLTGVVLSKNIEPGEYVAPGTAVVTVGDLVNVWLRGYIEETDLGRVKVGQRAWVTTDTYPGKKYEGRVSFISSEAEFTPKNVQTPKERVKLVYRIKIDITNPKMELKPGMPADAVIETGERDEGRGRGMKTQEVCNGMATSVQQSEIPLPRPPSLSPRHGRHSHQPTDEAVRRSYGRRWADAHRGRGGDLWPGGARRRRQDHHHAALDRHHGPHQRRGLGRRPPHCRRGKDQGTDRLHEPAVRALPRPDGHGEHQLLRRHLQRAAQGPPGKNRSAAGFSNLTPFRRRLAGNLSGGMKQKLGLVCALDPHAQGPVPRRAHQRGRSRLAPRFLADSLPTAAGKGDDLRFHGVSRRGRAVQPRGPDPRRPAVGLRHARRGEEADARDDSGNPHGSNRGRPPRCSRSDCRPRR